MNHNIVIAGVGGQGILTIARVLSTAAITKGLHVKQAEVHGMSQRGGAVYSHLRISDQEVFSDLIPSGQADLILAIEPLEALRYVQMLRRGGTIVASTNAEVNIGDYPQIESVLEHIAAFPNHVAIDMEKLARAAGGVLAANIVALGAASRYLGFSVRELEAAIESLFERKGERVVQTNLKAFRFGRTAASAYVEALQRGASPTDVRSWIQTLSPELLAGEDELEFAEVDEISRLTGAEAHAFESLLMGAYEDGRKQLYEHEVYRLIELVGAITPPRHTFVPKGSTIAEDVLDQYPGDRVVIKLVSSEIVHKSDAGAVRIVTKAVEVVRSEIDRLIAAHSDNVPVAGALVVEFIEHEMRGLGGELFVGIRATREFGPVIAAGLGGVQTEYLATKMRPGVAVAKAVAMDTDPEEFLEQFKQTAAYDILSGRTRGTERLVSDGELLRCFRAFISIARYFCVDRGEEGPDIGELEVNPFAFSHQRMIPLDGRGCLRTAAKSIRARSIEAVSALLEPKSIAMVGVSSKPDSLGRIILENVVKAGFDRSQITVVKKDGGIEGVRCAEKLSEPVDLLVVTAPATAVPEIIAESQGLAKSAIVISGGAGEAKGTETIAEEIRNAISASPDATAVLGPNCMGVQSRPGRYDTFFVPSTKMPDRAGLPVQPLALVSQSGAFVVSRLSALAQLNPAFSISLGNQIDVTVSDLLKALGQRADVEVFGVYLEGFSNLDGLETMRAVRELTQAGKTVVFYKAGRTETGRSAAAGHTAAVAGDYDICQTAMRQAGSLVVEDFRTFSQLVELSTFMEGKTAGKRLFAITNAGMEAVGMADSLGQEDVAFEKLSELFEADVETILKHHRLDSLVSLRNPLDVTPMAGEVVYDQIVRAALAREEIDGVIVSCVPLAPTLHTLATELNDPTSFPNISRAWKCDKPVVFVLDGGREYDLLGVRLREQGFPVFASADEAVKALARWISSKTDLRREKDPDSEGALAGV